MMCTDIIICFSPHLTLMVQDLSYKDKHWHEACFKCCDCQASLVDQPFASKDEKLYCADCHDNNFAARCDGCGNIFRAGESGRARWSNHRDCEVILKCSSVSQLLVNNVLMWSFTANLTCCTHIHTLIPVYSLRPRIVYTHCDVCVYLCAAM